MNIQTYTDGLIRIDDEFYKLRAGRLAYQGDTSTMTMIEGKPIDTPPEVLRIVEEG